MRHSIATLLILLSWTVPAHCADSEFFDSDGKTLRYFQGGSGETIVLLHGFSGSAEGAYIDSGTFAALVDGGYHVVALDQIGHGASDKPYSPDRYGLQMVEDVRRLLDHLGIQKCHLAGYSMGSKVANTFRSRYPERLHTTILGGYGWPWRSPQITYEEAQERLAERTILPGNDRDALAAVSTGMNVLTPTEDNLRNNSIPSFAIIGDRDNVASKEDFNTLKRTMSNLNAITIPGTHAGPEGALYKPRYAKEILAFLQQHHRIAEEHQE